MPNVNFDLGVENTEQFVRRSRRFTVGDLMAKNAKTRSETTAVVDYEREERYTFEELHDRVCNLASALGERGLEPNESRIAVLSENRAEIVETLYTGAATGTLVSLLNWRLEKNELLHCVDLVDPDFLIVSERFADKGEWIEQDAEADPAFVALDDGGPGIPFAELRQMETEDDIVSETDVDPEQGLAVIYTSGTTGLPKGVVISHRAFVARAAKDIVDWGIERGDSSIAHFPMFHQPSVDTIFTSAVVGGAHYTVDGFDPEAIVDIARQTPVHWLSLAPGIIQRMIDYLEDADVETDELCDIRCIGSLPDLSSPQKLQRLTELLNAPYLNSYGCTETQNVASAGKIPIGVKPTEELLSKNESSFVTTKLIDDEWNEVPQGVPGEMAVRGTSLFSGYLDNPEANDEEFRDGWFRTGDMLIQNDDGTYDFVDRRKYLIKSGGENIYPSELENLLLDHPSVTGAVVVRVPDDKWGEVPKAYVSPHPDANLTVNEVMDTLSAELANYKLPHYVEFVSEDEFPRSTSGKVVRSDVESWFEEREEKVRDV